MEYAKKVPKPKVLQRHNSVDNAVTACDSSRPAAAAAAMSVVTADTDFMNDELQRLQERHRAERQQVALLLHNNV